MSSEPVSNPMEIKYQPDANDYYAAQQYIARSMIGNGLWRHVPAIAGALFGICVTLGVIAIGRFYNEQRAIELYELSWGLWMIITGLAVITIGLLLYFRRLRQTQFSPDGIFCSAHSVRLAEDHIIMLVKKSEYKYSYDDIVKVEDDQKFVYIFIDNGAALYIPTSAFRSLEDRNSFCHAITDRRHKP